MNPLYICFFTQYANEHEVVIERIANQLYGSDKQYEIISCHEETTIGTEVKALMHSAVKNECDICHAASHCLLQAMTEQIIAEHVMPHLESGRPVFQAITGALLYDSFMHSVQARPSLMVLFETPIISYPTDDLDMVIYRQSKFHLGAETMYNKIRRHVHTDKNVITVGKKYLRVYDADGIVNYTVKQIKNMLKSGLRE